MAGVNHRDQQALVYLVERIRSETRGANEWHRPGIEAVVKRLAGHDLASALERVVRHAADPEARTPAAMERPFLPPAPTPGAAYPPKVDEACPDCGRHQERCVCESVPQLAGRRRPSGPAVPPTVVWRQAREALARPTDTTDDTNQNDGEDES